MQRVIVLEPESSGNIGFIARIIENFDIDEFIIVNPQCDVRGSETAKERAVHAQDTLNQARIVDTLEQAVDDLDYLVGTTGVTASDENILRTTTTPRQMTENVPKDAHIGLLFGREGTGLSNDELDQCDCVVSIPASEDYPVMNLSHAVAVICYEYFTGVSTSAEDGTSSSRRERDVLENLFKDITEKLEWSHSRQEKAVRAFRNVMGRAYITGRELSLLLGLFREVRDQINEVKRQENERE